MSRILERAVDSTAVLSLTHAGVHPVLARVLAARGIRNAESLDLSLRQLEPPVSLLDIGKASERLAQAIVAGERVAIVGDYDSDGGTATALLMQFIRLCGGNAFFLIPDRVRQGYGLSPALVDEAHEQGADLIITVDNGISAMAGVAAAHQRRIPVIVTDHHLPGETIPDAFAIVNPNQPGCVFPWKSTCGVGVAFYLAAATRRHLVQHLGQPEPQWRMTEFLDLVALGTVADVVPLERNNRILVQAGLQRILHGASRPGIRALLQVAGVSEKHVTAHDLGFTLGPRINAAGRLDDMGIGVRLLLSEDPEEAESLARQLDALNRERRSIEKGMLESAIEPVERLMGLAENEDAIHPVRRPRVVCLLDPYGHEGVVGLVAGRIRERVSRPVLVFAPGEDGEWLKGSARSVDGVHIRDILAEVDTRYPGMIKAFGGHAMAAGLTIHREHFAGFQSALNEVAYRRIQDDQLAGVLWTDGALEGQHIGFALAEAIAHSGPWGNGFPEPVFHGAFRVLESKRIGADENTLRLRLHVADGQPPVTAIRFRHGEDADPQAGDFCRFAFFIHINRYKNQESVQIQITEFLDEDALADRGAA